MNKVTTHILLPSLMPALFFLIASTPVYVLGCRTRGLLAILIAFTSGIAGIVLGLRGLKTRKLEERAWLTASILILTIPVIALLILA